MSTTNGGLDRKHLLENAVAYLATGILISISHHFHSDMRIVFFGHLLIAISFIILISMMLKHSWTHRINSALDIFGGTTVIITFALDITIFTVDELVYYHGANILSPNLLDSLFVTITIAVGLWVLLLGLPLILPAIQPRSSSRKRLLSFMVLAELVAIAIVDFSKILPLQNIIIGIIVLNLVIFFILQKNDILKSKRKRNFIFFSHLFLVLVPAFIMGGVLSFFTKAAPTSWFWFWSAGSFCALVIFVLLLDKWRKRLFKIVLICLAKIMSFFVPILKKVKFFIQKVISNLCNALKSIIATIHGIVRRMFEKVKKTTAQFTGKRKLRRPK